jgi:hypothetical protein
MIDTRIKPGRKIIAAIIPPIVTIFFIASSKATPLSLVS